MQLATLRTPDGTTRAARRTDDGYVLLDAGGVAALLADPSLLAASRDAVGPRIATDEAVLAPLVTPVKTICVGLNYREHILEMGRELPTHPTLFSKFPDALVGASDDIILHAGASSWDYEAELGIVIGSRVPRAADERTALAAIAGYTVVNDVTARDWQRRTLQWLQGKTWDATSPVGPTLVTPDEADPEGRGAPDLAITCHVDDALRQSARTSDLVFGPVDLVRYVSTFTTLSPGDLIATGTPGGVGAGMDPPGYLRPGQVLRTTVEGLGTCVNRCTAPG